MPTPTPPLETTDPAKYLRDEFGLSPGYGFNSPSGRLWCAIITELDEGTPLKNPLVGCETEQDIPNIDCEEIQGVGEPGFYWAPAIEFYRGGSAKPACYHDGGLFGGAVLPYNHSLRVLGITCTSRKTGMTCIDDKTGHGFEASKRGFVAVD